MGFGICPAAVGVRHLVTQNGFVLHSVASFLTKTLNKKIENSPKVLSTVPVTYPYFHVRNSNVDTEKLVLMSFVWGRKIECRWFNFLSHTTKK